MESHGPVLYSFRRCPYAMRARMALHISGVSFQLREVDLKAKPQAMLEASPKGTVPVLVLPEGEVIDQSLAIMMWALGKNDPEAWLSEPRASSWILKADEEFKRDLDRTKYPERFAEDVAGARERAESFLYALDALIAGEGGSYLFGRQRTLADIAIFPFVRQFIAIDRERIERLGLPHVKLWVDLIGGSDVFTHIMQKGRVEA